MPKIRLRFRAFSSSYGALKKMKNEKQKNEQKNKKEQDTHLSVQNQQIFEASRLLWDFFRFRLLQLFDERHWIIACNSILSFGFAIYGTWIFFKFLNNFWNENEKHFAKFRLHIHS